MVVDGSALLAILQAEPDGPRAAHAIAASRNRRVSAVSYVEASIVVLARYGEAGADKLGRLLHEAEIEIAPVTPDQARVPTHTAGSARAGIRRRSTWAIALRTQPRWPTASRCCSVATISRGRT